MKRTLYLILFLTVMLGMATGAWARMNIIPSHGQSIGSEQNNNNSGGYRNVGTMNNPNYYYTTIKSAPADVVYRQSGFSPDRQKIVAQKSYLDGSISRTEIVLMDADGTDEVIISAGNSGQEDIYGYMNPFWSYDGTAVGFAEVHNTSANKIIKYTLSLNTCSYIYEPAALHDASNPDFVGNSTTSIVFWDGAVGGADLFTWNGTTLTNITNTSDYNEYEPVSNNDGTKILYWSGESTLEPVNTTHTLSYTDGTWGKDVGFTPIPDTYWSYWSGQSNNNIGVTVMSSGDIRIYNSIGTIFSDVTGPGYTGGDGQWNFLGHNFEGINGEILMNSNAGRSGVPGRDIIIANPRNALYVNAVTGNDSNPGTVSAPFLTINKALTEAVAGGTVNVAAGNYPEQITITQSLSLIGAGETTTTILAPATRTGSVTHNGTVHDYLLAAYATSGTIDVRIEGFTFDVNGQIKKSGTSQMDGVFFDDVNGSTAGLFSSTIHNFETTEYLGFGLVVYGTSLLAVNDNNISDYTRDGISINRNGGAGSDPNVTISGNTITGSATPLNGINIDTVTHGAVTGNTITGNTRTLPWAAGGMVIWTSTGVPITGNHIDGNFYGINLQDNTNLITVSANELMYNIKRGITLDNSDNNTVKSNTITGPVAGTDDVGIALINTSTGNTIGGPLLADGNIITMASSGTANLYAIHMQADVGAGINTIQYNTITGGQRAVQFDGPPGTTGTTTVSNNIISGQGFGGICAYNNGSLIISANTLTNTVRPMDFWGPTDLNISYNTVNGANWDGINLGNVSGTKNITNNIISNSAAGAGIHCRADADNVVIDNNNISLSRDGIIIDAGSTGNSITNNNIHNNTFSGITSSEALATVTGNTIDNCLRGVETSNALTAHYNSFTNNVYGSVIFHNDYARDVTNNWWGNAAGPSVWLNGVNINTYNQDAQVGYIQANSYGNFTFVPWWSTSTGTSFTPVTIGDLDYASIQAAINAATAGANIYIAGGTYYGNIVIDEPVSLHGSITRDFTIIDGGGSGSVVTISANGVLFENFQVQNSGPNPDNAGIFIDGASNCTVQNNVVLDNAQGIAVGMGTVNLVKLNDVYNNDFYGIAVVAASGNTIELNEVYANGLDAIALDNAAALGGAVSNGSTLNIIKGNTVTSVHDGIFIGANCNSNTIGGPLPAEVNTISGTQSGIHVWKSDGQTITNNILSGMATGTGIRLYAADNNSITYNTISNNAVGLYILNHHESGVFTPCTGSFIQNNKFTGNTEFALKSDNFSAAGVWVQVDARRNYWGGTAPGLRYWSTGPAGNNVQGEIQDGSPVVLYDPWWANSAMTILGSIDQTTIYVTAPQALINDNYTQTYSVKAQQVADLRGFEVQINALKVDFAAPTGFAIGSSYLNVTNYPLGYDFNVVDVSTLTNWIFTVSGSYLGAYNGISGNSVDLFTFSMTSLPDVSAPVPTGSLVNVLAGLRALLDEVNAEIEVAGTTGMAIFIDSAEPDPIVWVRCRTLEDSNNKIDLAWTNPTDAFRNHIWRLDYDVLTGANAYPTYNPRSFIVPVIPAVTANGWVEIADIPAVTTYVDESMSRGYYYYAVYTEDASGNISGDPVSGLFYRESISYWPGDVVIVLNVPAPAPAVVNADDIGLLSGVWGLTSTSPSWNPIIDVGPSTDYARRSRPTPDNVINIEDLMMFAMNYDNTDYDVYYRGNKISAPTPIRIALNTQYSGSQIVATLSLGANNGLVKGLNVPLSYGTGLNVVSVTAGDIWMDGSLFLNINNNNVVEISGSVLGSDTAIEGNGTIATIVFDVTGELTEVELQHMIARTMENIEIDIIDNPLPTDNEDPEVVIPMNSFLGNNFPNPFNPTTTIQFGLKQASNVRIHIYNTRGQIVKTLVNADKAAGAHTVVWNGMDNHNRPAAAGVYFIKMEADGYSKINKALLLK